MQCDVEGIQTEIRPYLVPNLRIRTLNEETFLQVPGIPVIGISHTFRRNCTKEFAFFKLLLAAASMIFRPVIVDPVNATLSTSRWDARAAPPTGPRDGTVLTTPGGKLIQR